MRNIYVSDMSGPSISDYDSKKQ
ncbi:uncharacterized protein METZ01_LOCUS346309 [marine metagenome]|uniref:Uncharacterized protein n=1 Tax=marine metagenome TaxID=408172 RepID=A0A382R8E0_9ZZZZ